MIQEYLSYQLISVRDKRKNGTICETAVRANQTVTLHYPRGHFLYPGAEYTGKLIIEDIGIPEK